LKFFKNSILYSFDVLEKYSLDLIDIKYKYIYNTNKSVRGLIHDTSSNLFNQDDINIYYKNLLTYEILESANYSIDTNRNNLISVLVKQITKKGNKLKAYKIIRSCFYVFFSFFESFNSELVDTYPLYKLYYKYALNNTSIFYNPLFIFKNIFALLESSFTISVKKIKKRRKKIEHKSKEITIAYIIPERRIHFVLRCILLFSRTYGYDVASLKVGYSILHNFLSSKNSILFKKKLSTFDKLLKLRKIN